MSLVTSHPERALTGDATNLADLENQLVPVEASEPRIKLSEDNAVGWSFYFLLRILSNLHV